MADSPLDQNELFTPAQVIEALESSAGVILGAMMKLGCARNTVRNYIAKYPEVADALAEIRENNKDLAETQLISAVQKGQGWAIRHLLYWQAADRGYGPVPQGAGGDAPPVPEPPTPLRRDLSVGDLRELERILRGHNGHGSNGRADA
jgi:hypothetical protein